MHFLGLGTQRDLSVRELWVICLAKELVVTLRRNIHLSELVKDHKTDRETYTAQVWVVGVQLVESMNWCWLAQRVAASQR